MHEINTAAETITAAADPDANIIFGATINPELEGEIIITVVATGFEESYFTNRQHLERQAELEEGSSQPLPSEEVKPAEVEMNDINMDLDEPAHDSGGSEDFHAEPTVPNIWALHDDENDDDSSTASPLIPSDDDELEKPSFLRRFKRKSTDKKTDTEEDSKEDK
jgi:hypothetical protein